MVKVFLVEDEAIIRHGIRDNIDWASHGFEFAGEAGDGEYAYPLILKAQPDILVTDIKMPFMDGLELSRLVKKTLPRTRIIVLSGYNEFEYAKEAIKIGISDYLLKPVSSAGLIDATAREAAICIVRMIREERDRLTLPVHEILTRRMCPVHRPPFGLVRVVLIEEMVLVAKVGKAIRIIAPADARRDVEARIPALVDLGLVGCDKRIRRELVLFV